MSLSGPTAQLLPIHADPVLNVSDTLYLRGISPKVLSNQQLKDVIEVLREVAWDMQNYDNNKSTQNSKSLSESDSKSDFLSLLTPTNIDFSEREKAGSGSIYVQFSSINAAHLSLQALASLQFQGYFQGNGIICGFEIGRSEFRTRKTTQYNPVLRRVCPVGKGVQLEDIREWREKRQGQRMGGKLVEGKVIMEKMNSLNGMEQKKDSSKGNQNLKSNRDSVSVTLKDKKNSEKETNLELGDSKIHATVTATNLNDKSDTKSEDSLSDPEQDTVFNTADNSFINPNKLGKKKQNRKLRKTMEAERRRLENSGMYSNGNTETGESEYDAIEKILREQFPAEVFEYGGSMREEVRKLEKEHGREKVKMMRMEKDNVNVESDSETQLVKDTKTSRNDAFQTPELKKPTSSSVDTVTPTTQTKIKKESSLSKDKPNLSADKKSHYFHHPNFLKWGWNLKTGDAVEVGEEETEGLDTRKPGGNSNGDSGASLEVRTRGPKTTKAERKIEKKKRNQETSLVEQEQSENPNQNQISTPKSQSQTGKRQQKNPFVVLHEVDDLQYQQKCIVANRKTAYPCPSGVYLSRVVRRMFERNQQIIMNQNSLALTSQQSFKSSSQSMSLINLISNVDQHGGLKNYDKELSESLACVDAVERAIHLCTGLGVGQLLNNTNSKNINIKDSESDFGHTGGVNVFIVGDGKLPMTAACLKEFLIPFGSKDNDTESSNDSSNWNFFSIDPLMQEAWLEKSETDNDKSESKRQPDNLKPKNFHCYNYYSQNFHIDKELKAAGVKNWCHYEGVQNGVKEDDLECEEVVSGVNGPDRVNNKALDINQNLNMKSEDNTIKSLSSASMSVNKSDDKIAVTNSNTDLNHTISANTVISESFQIIPKHLPLSIVVGCHSHAPLRQFWERVPKPKLAVTLPCCERFSDLGRKPIFQYDDFEIFSPKRRIRIYKEFQQQQDKDVTISTVQDQTVFDSVNE